MIFIFLLIVILGSIFLYLRFKKKVVSNAKELTYVNYRADSNDKVYTSIILHFDTNKIEYIYKDGREEEKDIVGNDIFNKVNKLFLKYDVFNWNSYDKRDFEITDEVNDLIYYKFSNGDSSYADIQTVPIGKGDFFKEYKEFIFSL